MGTPGGAFSPLKPGRAIRRGRRQRVGLRKVWETVLGQEVLATLGMKSRSKSHAPKTTAVFAQ